MDDPVPPRVDVSMDWVIWHGDVALVGHETRSPSEGNITADTATAEGSTLASLCPPVLPLDVEVWIDGTAMNWVHGRLG